MASASKLLVLCLLGGSGICSAKLPSGAPTKTGLGSTTPVPLLLQIEAIYDFDESFLNQEPAWAWGIDPFERVPGYAAHVGVAPIPRLQAIIYSPTDATALINGEEYMVGDSLDNDFRVQEIGRNYVLIAKGDSLLELVIPPDENSTPHVEIREHTGRTR